MVTVKEAILVIRQTVQDQGDGNTSVGKPARLDQVRWLGNLLGFNWPSEYLELLSAHDGVTIRQAYMPAFFDAFRTFIVHREEWQGLQYWPIAEDGCGDYWVLPLKEQKNGDCPVYFLDHETEAGLGGPTEVAAESIGAFVIDHMRSVWARRDDKI